MEIACGSLHCVAVTDNNEVYTWGDNDEGQLGDGTTNGVQKPKLVPALQGNKLLNPYNKQENPSIFFVENVSNKDCFRECVLFCVEEFQKFLFSIFPCNILFLSLYIYQILKPISICYY